MLRCAAVDEYTKTLRAPGDGGDRRLPPPADGVRRALPGERVARPGEECFPAGLHAVGGGAVPPAAVTSLAPRLPLAVPCKGDILASGVLVGRPGEAVETC